MGQSKEASFNAQRNSKIFISKGGKLLKIVIQ